MGLLDTEGSTGIIQKPFINLIYGVNGIGKTTWACSFPNTAILDLENGSNNVRVMKRFQGKKNEQGKLEWKLSVVKQYLQSFRHDKHDFKTLAIDSVEVLVDGIIADAVCKEGNVESIEDFGKGFGKGSTRCREYTREIFETLQDIRDNREMTINLVAHAAEKSHTDPANGLTYQKYSLRTSDKSSALIRDLCDNVFFATRKILTGDEVKKNIYLGVSDGKAVLKTKWQPGYDAKTRINLPSEISMDSYEIFAQAVLNSKPQTMEELREELFTMVKGVSDKATQETANGKIKAAQSYDELLAIKNRLSQVVKQVA